MNADQLRDTFTGFFADRGHAVVPSASLLPHDPSVLFTIAGMVPFKPYFLGEEAAPWPRATSVQKCFRTVDIEVVGTTRRHCTFFEMLGNFSFGDYFKHDAVTYAWELLTEVLGVDGDRLWVTVHESDDEAAGIWLDAVGFPAARLQRLGEENIWRMGDTGPCGTDSEIFFDLGDRYGEGGGPAVGHEERYVEIWNLVFMQSNRLPDGSLADLPKKCIDTGSGLERMLPVLAGVDSVFRTDVLEPMVDAAQSLTGRALGTDDPSDVALRVLADHGRAMTMLVSDGVLPANEGRGYVLRRVVRRAVLAARRLGTERGVTGRLVEAAAAVMGSAYPEVPRQADMITAVLEREEAGFDRTLRTGLGMLEDALGAARAAGPATPLSGEVAFRLHDTHGFPIELTEELAAEAGVAVDRAGFDDAMAEQRARARAAARTPTAGDEHAYRALLEREGPTEFVGRSPGHYAVPTVVTAVMAGTEPGTAEIFLQSTPFYAEGGGQLGDTGTIVTETGTAHVVDTVAAVPGLTAHRARVEGELFAGQDALATIDGPRREALRRNHTATHLLHAALRSVLGDHVRQQGSEVGPDRLRFDFSHHAQPAPEELAAVAQIANTDVLTDDRVQTIETTKAEAEQMGAVAYFGDKYGDQVRVVRAGPHSLEFCGGTHVDALGQIGPIAIVSEGSVGANTRRIFAVTAEATLARDRQREALLAEAASLLRTEPEGVVDALQRVLDRQREADKELQRLRGSALESDAAALADAAAGGVVVARRDGLSPDELRALAQAVRRRDGLQAVVIGGTPDDQKVSIAVVTGGRPDATVVAKQVAAVVQGGGGGTAEVALAGGRDVSRIDEALEEARQLLAAR